MVFFTGAKAQDSAADFTIHSQVVASSPPRFGFNLQESSYYADITDNAWIADSCFSSADLRMNYLATDDGASDGTTFIETDVNSAGTDFWASINSNGAYVGANARLYRFNTTTNQWNLLRTGVVQSMTAVPGSTLLADHTITFTTPGPQSKAGDALWLSKDGNYQNPDVSQWVNYLDPRFNGYATSFNAEGESVFARNDTNACTYIHVTDVPPGELNGQADAPPLSVKITDSATGTGGIWQYVQGWGNGGEQLETGHTYTVSVWLKQQGIADGSATFIFGPLRHTFTGLTNVWQQYTYSFPSPGVVSAGGQTARVDYNAPGTLWVNQLEFYDAAHGPFTLDARALQVFQNFHPGTVRLWSGFANCSGGYSFWSLDSMLQDESATREDYGIGNMYGLFTVQQKLPAGLSLCSQLGANPWIIGNMSWSEQEWSNLIDYLAAPAGVGYAVKRPASHPGPYTADFQKIYLEFGNEEWGTQETAVNGHYGNYAHYMFSQAVAGKSYYDSSKIKLILNSFIYNDSFGQTALTACPEGQALDYFLYTGTANVTGDTVYQDDLLSIATYQASINAWAASEQASAAAGHPYEIASYEGGPGSDNPNFTGGGDTSLAAAVGQLDVYLYAQQKGATSLNFFLYHLDTPTSTLYSSHTNFAHGYIPHPVWEALQMRNQYCAGDLVAVDANTVQATTDGKATPLAAVYCFHDTTSGDQADIVVVSRDLNNSTPVTLHLPAVPTGSATLYTLTGDPRANNESSLVVPIGQQSISSFGQNYSFTMPAGSVYLFQVPTGPWAASGPGSVFAQGGTGYVTLNWTAIAGATSYTIYRSTSAAGGGAAYVTGVSGTTYTDTSVTNGTTYYYSVAAVTTGGATDRSSQVTATPVAASPFIAINAGGSAIAGTPWVADTDNDGGGFTETTNATQTIPASLANAAPAAVYQTHRARGTYTIPGLTSGVSYTLRIHGAENFWTTPGQRLQDINLNGVTVDTKLDWFTISGGENIAANRSYAFVAPASGQLVLDTTASTGSADGNPTLAGIEVLTGAPPLAPTQATASPASGQVTLSWKAAPGADTHTIQYGTASGKYTQTVTNVAGTSALVTGLTNGTTYYFVVAGVNADGLGALSSEVNATPNAVVGPPVLQSAVSRMTHGGGGTFDIPLPLTGSPGIECREGATAGSYTLVLTFNVPLASGSATVSSGTGVAGAPVCSGTTMTVPLTGVSNDQKVTVTFSNVLPQGGGSPASGSVTCGFLIGDVNGDGAVTTTDVIPIRNAYGMSAGAAGFNMRADINCDGVISTTDVLPIKQYYGTVLH